MNTKPESVTLEQVKALDAADQLAPLRQAYHLPLHNNQPAIYLCGNSLGLQPRQTKTYIEEELQDWATLGVEGHLHGKNPWFYYHHFLEQPVARLVGASPLEVVVMNNLTVNLNLLMVSFYRPTKEKFKIVMEQMAFPSDQYAAEMQVRYHGFNPDEAIVELKPRPGEHTLRTEDILETIEQHGSEVALVLIGGVQYYTGQYFDIAAITQMAHQVGAYAGFDLAHAAGNVPLHLHDWGVDFACWCTYKYLNSGPGGVSGVFIHERFAYQDSIPRFAGWWGNEEATRFQMKKGFHPQPGAAGWQQSNAPVLAMAAHRAAIELFDRAGMEALRRKSVQLTAVLEHCLLENMPEAYQIITPSDPEQRGCQLSILTDGSGKATFEKLSASGVIADWREPNVIRVAPVPMYNTFEEVWRFAGMMKNQD